MVFSAWKMLVLGVLFRLVVIGAEQLHSDPVLL